MQDTSKVFIIDSKDLHKFFNITDCVEVITNGMDRPENNNSASEGKRKRV